jgi:hypothetical protein
LTVFLLLLPTARAATTFSLQADSLSSGGADVGGRFSMVASFAGQDVAQSGAGDSGIETGFAAAAFAPPVAGREEAIEPSIEVTSALTRNPQTGLVELRVQVRNTWVSSIGGVRLFIEGLPAGVTVYNAAQTGATPHVQHGVELAVGQTNELVIEFYSTNRSVSFAPTLRAVAFAGGAEATPAGAPFDVRRAQRLAGGAYLIEFASATGQQYQVQYTTNLLNSSAWRTAPGVLTASGSTVVWVDNGPPKTDLHLAGSSPRFYRVVRLQSTGGTP